MENKDLQELIARQLKCEGFTEVEPHMIDEAFPHPKKFSLRELDGMISAALADNIPPPHEQPTQEEQIVQWCSYHGFEMRRPFDKRTIEFHVPGFVPQEARGQMKAKCSDCQVGDMVAYEDAPVKLRDRSGFSVQWHDKSSGPSFPDRFSGGISAVAEMAKVETASFERVDIGPRSFAFRRTA